MHQNDIPAERFSSYLTAAGHDPKVAMELYVWNIELGEAFFPLLAILEIAFRDAVARRLRDLYGAEWWENTAFHELIGNRAKGIVLSARDRRRNHKTYVTHGCMTAELTFGFWTGMLLDKYHESLWSPPTDTFPNLPPGQTAADLSAYGRQAADLRNRVFHHEPIFRRDISNDYSRALELLRWISPNSAAWLKPRLRVMEVMRRRPRARPGDRP